MTLNETLITDAVTAAAEDAFLPQDSSMSAYVSVETDDGRSYQADVIIASDGDISAIEQTRRCQVLLRLNLGDFAAYMGQYSDEDFDEDSDDSGYVIEQFEGNIEEVISGLRELLVKGGGCVVVDAFSEF